MSTPSKPRSSTPTVFEQQREELVREIAGGMEQVLQNINRLNRNLESIIAVGNEFGSVEALWSQFENFMAQPEPEGENAGRQKESSHEGEGHSEVHHDDVQEGELAIKQEW